MRRLKCSQVRRFIASTQREEWPDAVREALEAHLADCPSCRRDQALTDLIRDALRRAPTHRVPNGFTAAVMERLTERELLHAHRRSRWAYARPAYRQALVAAALAVVLLGAIFMYVHYHSQALPQFSPEVAQVSGLDLSLVDQLVCYHEQAAAQDIGTDAGVLMASAGP